MKNFVIAQIVPNVRQCLERGRQPGSTGWLHQLLRKLHSRRVPTPAPQAPCPLARPRSPLSLPHSDSGNACKEWWSVSQVVERLVSDGALSHK